MIVWNPVFLSEHESAWGLLQKLSWFNEASPIRLFQRVSTLRFGPCDPSVRARTFMDTDWLAKEPIPCEPPEPADAGSVMGFANLQRAIVQRSGRAQWGDIAPIILDAQLRYCPACLAQGYHSIVHQLCGLAVCPRHRLPLVRHCIHCHAATPLFALRTHPQAFRCQRCRQSWLDGELEPITAQDAEWNNQTIGCVRRWGARIAALPYEWKQWDVEIFHDHAFPTDAVTDGMVSIGQAAVWLLHDVEPFPEPGWLRASNKTL